MFHIVRRFMTVVLFLVFAAVIPAAVFAQIPPPTVYVDAKVRPKRDRLPGQGEVPRLLASVSDAKGNQGDFVEGEILLFSKDRIAVDKLAARWGGKVQESFEPSDAELTKLPTVYRVRIDPNLVSLGSLPKDLQLADPLARGELRFSSIGGMRTLAAAARAQAEGVYAGLNWIMESQVLRDRSSLEAGNGYTGPDGVNYSSNAFNWPYMRTGGNLDIGVAEAWRIMEINGRFANRVSVVLMDGGFAPNADFPTSTQILPNGSANVPNPGTCGGSPCPFHGTDVLGAGFAVPDNNFGGAGPGSPVADITAIQSPADLFGAVDFLVAILGQLGRTDIVNISSGVRIPAGGCLFVCSFIDGVGLGLRELGTLVVASAGNNGEPVDEEDCFLACWEEAAYMPCEASGVLCVGGLNWNSTSRHPNSNYSSDPGDCCTVDLFAPYQVWVAPGPGESGTQFVSGTSFASPFTAGVAALYWATEPRFNDDEVFDLLINSAHPSSDNQVRRYVNAYDPILDLLGGDAPPFASIVSPTSGQQIERGTWILFQGSAWDDEDGQISNALHWTSDLSGWIGTGSWLQHQNLAYGRHRVSAAVTDSAGNTDTAVVEFDVIQAPPVMDITEPFDGAQFFRNQTITLRGTSFDRDTLPLQRLTDAQVSWKVDGNPIATGHNASIAPDTLTLGLHDLTFQGSDGTFTRTDTVRITINPTPTGGGGSPTVSITSPAAGATLYATSFATGGYAVPITLQGTATDPEDGALIGGRLVWSSSYGNLGIGTSLSTTMIVPSMGTYPVTITLTATDSAGNARTAQVTITVVVDGSRLL